MKQILFSFIFICSSLATLAQSNINYLDSLIEAELDSANILYDFNALKAEEDIAKKEIYLLLPGTIGCPPAQEGDSLFESAYELRYTCIGCNSFGFLDAEGYNQVIFNYLSKKYGKSWMNQVRKDVIGIDQYR